MPVELPPITRHRLQNRWVDVIRFDAVHGGLKTFGINGLFTKGAEPNLVFASNSLGYGSLAFTLSTQKTGKHPIIFLSKHDSRSPNLNECERLGADLVFEGKADPSDSASLRLEAMEKYKGNQYSIIPMGLDTPEVRRNISETLQAVFRRMDKPPEEIWVATATGLIAMAAQGAMPFSHVNAVIVKHNEPELGKAKPFWPDEKFTEKALLPPPYKSAPHYDAKVWAEVIKHGRLDKRAAIINVA